jgi:hypothetical protein
MPLNPADEKIEMKNRSKPQEDKLEKPEQHYIPFTHKSQILDHCKLDNIILSYLPAPNLEALNQSTAIVDFETQACIKIPAGDALNEGYKILLERLPKSIYSPAPGAAPIVDYKTTYLNVVKDYKTVNYFTDNIKKVFNKNETPYSNEEIDIELMREIIFHYCLNFPVEAGIILNDNIFSEKTQFLQAMIESGADIHIGRRERSTFAKAIYYCRNDNIINSLFEKDIDYKAFEGHFYEFFKFDFSRYYYLKAIMHFSNDNLIKIANEIPQLLPFFFSMLDVIIEKKSSYTDYITNGDRAYNFSYNSATALYTKFKLQRICHKKLTYTKSDKEVLFGDVLKRINSAPTIADLSVISKEHHTAFVLNYQRHYYLDKVIRFFDKKFLYTQSKIKFLEALQNKAYAIVTSEMFIKSSTTSPLLYLVECKAILELPFFSETHCNYGVDKTMRKKLLHRISEIEAAIPLAPSQPRPFL